MPNPRVDQVLLKEYVQAAVSDWPSGKEISRRSLSRWGKEKDCIYRCLGDLVQRYYPGGIEAVKGEVEERDRKIGDGGLGIAEPGPKWVRFIDECRRRSKWAKREETYRTTPNTFRFDGPTLIQFSGDAHFGCPWVDYDLWYSEWTRFLDLPIHGIELGDFIENSPTFFRNAAVTLNQLIKPLDQKEFLWEIVSDLAHRKCEDGVQKLLGWNSSNHLEGRDERYSDGWFERELGKIIPCYVGDAWIDVTVCDLPYSIACRHQLPGKSIHNKVHHLIRSCKEGTMQADIVASAHYHDPGMTQQIVGDKLRTLLQVGTWKTGDDFFSLEYFARGRHGIWIALLTGQRLKDGQKHVEVFQDQECAVDAMRFYRKRLGLKEAA